MSDLSIEIQENIISKTEFSKAQLYADFVKKCVIESREASDETVSVPNDMTFKLKDFFNGFASFINEFGKDKKYLAGVHALSIICEELGIEIEEDECFVLFHLRGLGKFKLKEDKLHKELTNLWGTYPQFKLTDEDFSYTLKKLMRLRFIDYRKGSLQLKNVVNIRFRRS